MPHLYYITNRQAFSGSESSRQQQLLEKIKEAAAAGVDYIQLREKDLSARALENLARAALQTIKEVQLETGSPQLKTKLLINSRTDIALAAGADGVHLRSNDISPEEVRTILSQYRNTKPETENFLVCISCHTIEDVRHAEREGADFAVLAPIFGKLVNHTIKPRIQTLGLDTLRTACVGKLPVFALGGVTIESAQSCLAVGAAGIAGIHLFQENDIDQIVRQLCS